jgi:recombination protein U
MAIRYPNGRQYTPKNKAANSDSKKKSDILAKDKLTFSNRGKSLEDDIDEANAFYLQRGTAVIHKKPVPVQIVKVEYPSRSAAVIREAYFRTPSTTDYMVFGTDIILTLRQKKQKTELHSR